MGSKTITVNALRVLQRKDIPIFVFGIEGRLVHQIATVNYAQRNADGILQGYQRGAVDRHIRDILKYLASEDAILPNAIVLALDERASFSVLPGVQPAEWGTPGRLELPLPQNGSDKKVGWIVDGQQRATALSKLRPDRPFPVVVTAFQCQSPELQREQFIYVNKTKPLPRDLLNELLPEVRGPLPQVLEKTQTATRVLHVLRFSVDSPFFGRIKGLGAKGEAANISQAALLAVIQGSISRKGVLFDYLDANGKVNAARMALVLSVFFSGVRRTWPEAWDGTPRTSRLVHGVGIVALGFLMDRVMREIDANSPKAASTVANRLERIRGRCAWTKGKWPVLGCAWNELQNTSQDKARLTDFILKEYAKAE